MDRILIIMKRKMDTRASSVPLMWLFSIIFKHVYWYIQHISGERLQDHWSSGLCITPFIQLQQTRKGLPNADINNCIAGVSR